ncbi:putative dehydrogenase [Shimia isoporae]|uniref:Putative dehydrogenase n=1 Tax=Shimia isoporae TaxID=647720 RepID=A0A4R1NL26_9RHOB|nr:Gfo/Idh/MocA family oxidoreductase [Shimia isoporae]TCL08381.1 putative dehydrogenase [Shimia isoporae]
MPGLTVAVLGLGYFSQFHLKAWSEDPRVSRIVATDLSEDRRRWAAHVFDIEVYQTLTETLESADVDIVDIVAPPPAHAALVEACLSSGRIIVCQKPFCTSIEEAESVVSKAADIGASVVIHENFRFQPWHRTIKLFLDEGRMGTVFQCRFNLRPGDGRGKDAYLSRQPAFREMPRLLIHETGVHFIDLFRWLFGEISEVYADLLQINSVLKGEDAGEMRLTHENGVRSVFDGNRLMDHVTDNARRTMGEMWIEGEKGTLRLDGSGQVHFRPFGAKSETLVPLVEDIDEESFGGGCVACLCNHVSAAATGEGVLENEARDYLEVIRVTEAAYQSDATGQRVKL